MRIEIYKNNKFNLKVTRILQGHRLQYHVLLSELKVSATLMPTLPNDKCLKCAEKDSIKIY